MLVHAGTDIIVAISQVDDQGNALPLKPIEIHVHRLEADWDEALSVIQARIMGIVAELAPPPPDLPPAAKPARRSRKKARTKE